MATKSVKTKAAKAVSVAKPTPPPAKESAPPARSARALRQELAAKRRQRQNLLVYSIGALIVLAIGIGIYLTILADRPIVGEEVFTSQGNYHFAFNTPPPVDYNSTPPSSGPHYENLAAWGVHSDPERYELLIHNLEDGGVIVYYQCPEGCPETVEALRRIVQPYLDDDRHVVLAPNDPTWMGGGLSRHEDMGAKIAIVAWTRVLKLDEVDAEKINAFIEHYEGKDHHVPGIG